MHELLQIEQGIPASGEVDSDQLEALRLALFAGGAIGRPAVDCLVKLGRWVQYPNSGFEQLFYRAIKDHVLKDGPIDVERASWLRHNLFADAEITDEEQAFLRGLIGETDQLSLAVLDLLAEAMKFPEARVHHPVDR